MVLSAGTPGWLAAQVLDNRGRPPADVAVSPPEVTFPAPDRIDFDAGWVDHEGVAITVVPKNKKRNGWRLYLNAAAPDMGGYGKPVGDIMVQVGGSGSWIPLTTTPQPVAEGSGATTVMLHFRLRLDMGVDLPGTYSVPLDYMALTF